MEGRDQKIDTKETDKTELFENLVLPGGEAIFKIQRGKILCLWRKCYKKEELENKKSFQKLKINESFYSAENWRTREPNRKETIHPYILLEFSIVNILPIQLDRGKIGNNIKEILQKGEILK